MYYLRRKKKKEEKPMPLFDNANIKIQRKVNYVARLDKVFSEYIRLRDTFPNGMFRCISCGKFKPYSQADCGHYHSRTHMNTRFDEDNCNAECKHCNRFVADHLIGYRENLIAKIGEHRFDVLSWKAHQTKKWSEFELKELIKHYKVKIAELKQKKGL